MSAIPSPLKSPVAMAAENLSAVSSAPPLISSSITRYPAWVGPPPDPLNGIITPPKGPLFKPLSVEPTARSATPSPLKSPMPRLSPNSSFGLLVTSQRSSWVNIRLSYRLTRGWVRLVPRGEAGSELDRSSPEEAAITRHPATSVAAVTDHDAGL